MGMTYDTYELLKSMVESINEHNKNLDGYLNVMGDEFNDRLKYLGIDTIKIQGDISDTDGYTELVQQLVGEGISESDAQHAVNNVWEHCGIDPAVLVGCRAIYSKDNDKITIYNVSADAVGHIWEWSGELNHSRSYTMILISLLYDSGYSLSDLGLGIDE